MLRRKPLVAKTPLKAFLGKNGAKRSRIRPVGKAARRIAPAYHSARGIAMERANGRCEYCERPAPLAPHHVFMRAHLIGIEVSNLPEAIMAVCRECHDRAHANKVVMDVMRWICADRLSKLWNLPFTAYRGEGWSPLQAVRDMMRRSQPVVDGV